MTLSATTQFGIATEQQTLIDEAYERIGREASELSANDVQSAIRSLSFVFSEWANRGVNLWKVSLQTQALTQGLDTFALNSNVVDVLQIYKRQTQGGVNTDTMLSPISRAEYAAIPNKQQQSANGPNQFYFDRVTTPNLFIWQVPADSTFTLGMYVMLMQDDPGSPTNTLDAPQRWFDAMASALAARLSEKWAPDRYDRLMSAAARAFDFSAAEDSENVPLRITPDVLGRRWP